jgi:hypothetical protein
MKFLQTETYLGDADCSTDVVKSSELLLKQFDKIKSQLSELKEDKYVRERLRLLLDGGYVLLDLERNDEAWKLAREAFSLAAAAEAWEPAVEACDILFKADQPESVKALGHGIWLGVTYPIDPELSVAMLNHLVDATPPQADGAAVAATAARYIADMRAEGQQREDLLFFTGQLLGDVARRHRGVETQELFDVWFKHLELDDPEVFLPRLGQIVDTLVPAEWWIDRDALRAKLPVD